MRIPYLASGIKRPNPATPELSTDAFDDTVICSVILAAVERVVESPLHVSRLSQAQNDTDVDRGVVLSLLTMIRHSGVLITSDVAAQLMDIVKYCTWKSRDSDARLLLSQLIRDQLSRASPIQRRWNDIALPVDGRVVGRYLAARDPWSAEKFSYGPDSKFGVFREVAQSDGSQQRVKYSAADVEERWGDAQVLISSTGAWTEPVTSQNPPSSQMEVFTGCVCLLWHMLLRQDASRDVQTCDHLGLDAIKFIFERLKELKFSCDRFCDQHGIGPELEFWECTLKICRAILDYAVVSADRKDEFFKAVGEFRSVLLKESRERFGGRFSAFWLEEI
jgi:hypothetical protein